MLGKQLARLEAAIQDSEARLVIDDARLRHSVSALRDGGKRLLSSKMVMVGGAALGALGTFFWTRSHRHARAERAAAHREAEAEFAHVGRRRRPSWLSMAQRWSPIVVPMLSPLLDRKVANVLAMLGLPVVVKPIEPLPTMAQVDLTRYVGRWFEIARLPTRHESECATDVSADYQLDEDGGITVVNRCVKADGSVDEAKGRARVPDTRLPGQMEVTFAPSVLRLWPGVWADYWLLFVDDAYSVALVGEPERKNLWILARKTHIDAPDLDAIKSLAARHGFDTTRLIKTMHTAAQPV